MIKSKAITHIGIAVADLEKAIADFCSLFQFDRIERFEMAEEDVLIAMLKMGSSEIELLCPMEGKGPISKFINERGEGLHHVAIRVQAVSKAIEEAKRLGLRVLDDKPRLGARGAEAAFVHPKSLHGVLIEFYNM